MHTNQVAFHTYRDNLVLYSVLAAYVHLVNRIGLIVLHYHTLTILQGRINLNPPVSILCRLSTDSLLFYVKKNASTFTISLVSIQGLLCTLPQQYAVSQPRRPRQESSPTWKT